MSRIVTLLAVLLTWPLVDPAAPEPREWVFRWDYSAADVATAGKFQVQFSAAFGSSPTPQKSITAEWQVLDSIE